jgi:hypothetical protein
MVRTEWIRLQVSHAQNAGTGNEQFLLLLLENIEEMSVGAVQQVQNDDRAASVRVMRGDLGGVLLTIGTADDVTGGRGDADLARA